MAAASSAFDDPAEDPLSEGGAWQDGPGTFPSAKKSGGLMGPSALGGSYSGISRRASSFGGTQFSQGRIGAWNAGDYLDLCVRIAGASDGDGYMLEASGPTGNWILYRVDDDGATITATQLGAAFSGAPANGDLAKLTASSSTLEFFKNAVTQGTRTDATYSTGQPGLGGYIDAAGSSLRTAWTEWYGGDGAGAAWMDEEPVQPSFAEAW